MPAPLLVYLNDHGCRFRKALIALRQKGGANQRAYNEACRIIESLRHGQDESNKITNNGENRIRGCVKYELGSGAHRLVTVHSDRCIYLLHVGTHEEVERWLDQKRGYVITCNPKSKEIRTTIITTQDHGRIIPPHDPATMPSENTPYVLRVPGGFDPTEFIKGGSLAREISRVDDDTTDSLLLDLIGEIHETDPAVGDMIYDVLVLVRDGLLDGAAERIKAHRTLVAPVQDLPEIEGAAILDAVNSENLVVLTGMSEFDLEKLLAPDRFQDWMLFPHPEQKRIASEAFTKPVVLTGVSGSGKTCILLHRARHLAAIYPGQRIGILTLNRSLAKLLRNLLAELCSEEEMQNIEVHAFYDYFKQLVDWFAPMAELENLRRLAADHEESELILRAIDRVDPSTYAREFDPISGETLDDTWKIFLDNPRVATLMTYFKQHLFTYDDWTDSSKYLREEFSLIRSAVSTDSRVEQYTTGDFEREGRCIPFPEKIRRITLDLLLHLEEEMLTGGILDELSLTLALLPHLKSFSEMPEHLRFRCLLVDEFQDLSTRDLTLLRRVVTITDPDSFFLCGDSVQKVLVKSLNLNRAGLAPIDISRRRIMKNYRNSKNILLAASNLARIYGEEARKLKEDVETLDPELAVRETACPQAIEARPGQELSDAWEQAREILETGGSIAWSICIVTACDEDDYSVGKVLAACPDDFPVKAEKLTGDYTRHQDTMTVASMSDVKGFEFSMVIIVGCGIKTLPNPGRPRNESWRDALRLYVAMTRARDGVQLYYTGEPSPFLTDMNEHIEWFEQSNQTAST